MQQIPSCPNKYEPFKQKFGARKPFSLCCGKKIPLRSKRTHKGKSGKVWSNSPTCKLTGARLTSRVTISELFRRCCSSLTDLLRNKLDAPPFNACGQKVRNLQPSMEKCTIPNLLLVSKLSYIVKDEFKIHYTMHMIQRGPHYGSLFIIGPCKQLAITRVKKHSHVAWETCCCY